MIIKSNTVKQISIQFHRINNFSNRLKLIHDQSLDHNVNLSP